jgi:hypothetical protein
MTSRNLVRGLPLCQDFHEAGLKVNRSRNVEFVFDRNRPAAFSRTGHLGPGVALQCSGGAIGTIPRGVFRRCHPSVFPEASKSGGR